MASYRPPVAHAPCAFRSFVQDVNRHACGEGPFAADTPTPAAEILAAAFEQGFSPKAAAQIMRGPTTLN